jgi:hypothetical protein
MGTPVLLGQIGRVDRLLHNVELEINKYCCGRQDLGEECAYRVRRRNEVLRFRTRSRSMYLRNRMERIELPERPAKPQQAMRLILS